MTTVPDKPALNNELLMHYGVKGMRWGQTRTSKPSGSDIREARARVQTGQNKLARQRSTVRNAPTVAKRDAQKTKYNSMKKDFLKNPDRVTATRMTRGEKAVALVLFGPGGVGAIAGTAAVSRNIQKKQQSGSYDRK